MIAVTFFGTSIAATILPWRKKSLYQNSAIAKYKWAGIPMITVTGTLTALFLGYNLYKWLWPPFNSSSGNLYAINVPDVAVVHGVDVHPGARDLHRGEVRAAKRKAST